MGTGLFMIMIPNETFFMLGLATVMACLNLIFQTLLEKFINTTIVAVIKVLAYFIWASMPVLCSPPLSLNG